MLPLLVAEPVIITLSAPDTTTRMSTIDIATTQPTFSTAPSTTAGNSCQLDADGPIF